MSEKGVYPYVVFLPAEEKFRVLKAVFGSKIPIDILRFSIKHGISTKIYQKDLVNTLPYSNKTIIEHLKMLTKRGRWFALLLAEKNDLTETEKTEIFCNVFKSYVKWAKEISQKLNVSKKVLQEIFDKEMT